MSSNEIRLAVFYRHGEKYEVQHLSSIPPPSNALVLHSDSAPIMNSQRAKSFKSTNVLHYTCTHIRPAHQGRQQHKTYNAPGSSE